MNAKSAIRLSTADNVAVVLEAISADEVVAVSTAGVEIQLGAREDIPPFFKIALEDIALGSPVIKYGEPIGIAAEAIPQGSMVHVHNLHGTRGRGDLVRKPER